MLDPRWLPYRRPKARPAVRLFCFAHAGGGASLFVPWRTRCPEPIEVCAVQLPGREARFLEPRFTSMTALVAALADAWIPDPVPFAMFGSSLGARVAFELTRELRRRSLSGPRHLFVAASRAPHLPRTTSDHELTLDAWIEQLRERGELSDAEVAERELLELVHPVIRDDLTIIGTHEEVDEAPLAIPVTGYALTRDARIVRADVEAWRAHTTGAFECIDIDGVHNFLKTGGADVCDHVSKTLRASLR